MIEAKTEKPWTKQMAILAKVYLTPPPTSADVERLFSSGSHVLNKFRNRFFLIIQKNCFSVISWEIVYLIVPKVLGF